MRENNSGWVFQEQQAAKDQKKGACEEIGNAREKGNRAVCDRALGEQPAHRVKNSQLLRWHRTGN